MLKDYKGSITVKIDGIAASAASVISMAGAKVLMSPTALMMIHNPLTVAIGDSAEMQKAIDMLAEVKESIINAYQIKSGQGRKKLSKLMDAETWLSAHTAIEMGFADGILGADAETEVSAELPETTGYTFSRRAVTNSLLDKMKVKSNKTQAKQSTNEHQPEPQETPKPQGIPVDSLKQRLNLILH